MGSVSPLVCLVEVSSVGGAAVVLIVAVLGSFCTVEISLAEPEGDKGRA